MLLRPIDRSLHSQDAGYINGARCAPGGTSRPTTSDRPSHVRGRAAAGAANRTPPDTSVTNRTPSDSSVSKSSNMSAHANHNDTFASLKVTPNGLRMADEVNYDENAMHKTILVGDSGVGKTSLLVQFDQGKFSSGSFSATVGIGFTVMLIGDSGVGKTCLLVRFKDNAFLCGNFISTVGIDFRNKVVNVDGTKVKLQIWDTAGQERFRSVTHAYYRDAHALLLLYDVTNKASFDNIRAWLAEINEYAQDDVVIMLLGNKADMSAERVIRTEDGQRLAKEYDVAFMETSAKTGLNVELAFMAVARDLKSKKTRQPDEPRFNVADYVDQEKQKAGCCS